MRKSPKIQLGGHISPPVRATVRTFMIVASCINAGIAVFPAFFAVQHKMHQLSLLYSGQI